MDIVKNNYFYSTEFDLEQDQKSQQNV